MRGTHELGLGHRIQIDTVTWEVISLVAGRRGSLPEQMTLRPLVDLAGEAVADPPVSPVRVCRCSVCRAKAAEEAEVRRVTQRQRETWAQIQEERCSRKEVSADGEGKESPQEGKQGQEQKEVLND